MKKRIMTALCCICLLSAGRAHAQWVVTDPGNLAQGIINAAKNIVPGRSGALLPLSPLRTVHESFQSYGSSSVKFLFNRNQLIVTSY